ncbi:MAG: hypothetical protein WEB59_13225 [Thermoanaerobaculia bacterium]
MPIVEVWTRKAGSRGTVVRDLSRAGVPQTIAKKITGHKTDAVYDRYSVTIEDTLAAWCRAH